MLSNAFAAGNNGPGTPTGTCWVLKARLPELKMFARIAEVNEMVAAIGAEHVSLVAPLPERQSLGDGTVIRVSSRSLIVESLYQFAHAAHRARLNAIGKLVQATRRRI